MKKGVIYAILAYAIWGFLPIYWKALQSVPAMQIINHRVLWSLVFLALVLTLTKGWKVFSGKLTHQNLILYLIAACLLGINWLIYIWSVNAGHILDASLGYFINPLVSVLLGVIFLRERLPLMHWIAVGLAALGVVYMTISYNTPPWIALSLAVSFGLYGFIKKTAPLGSLPGLTLETAMLSIPALTYLLFEEAMGRGALGHSGLTVTLLLMFCGVITAIPLLLFAGSTHRIPLYMLGMLQYISPTIQLLLGVFLYNEPFDQARIISFALIWSGLVVYTLTNLWGKRKVLSLEGS